MNHYANHEFSYSDDDDDDLAFQGHDDDVEMSYSSTPNLNHTLDNNHSMNLGSDSDPHYNSSSLRYLGASYGSHVGQSVFGEGRDNSNAMDNTITSSNTNTNNTGNNINTAPTSQPPEKIRKKPGRKPGPICPALRKEQNRAAQRAFRDRKERHLHQLENMIKDIKNQHFLVTSRYQREARQLKSAIESLQSENYYLREVVFAFESALSKGNHIEILKEVKQELFRRHYENKTASASEKSFSPPVPSTTPTTPATPNTSAAPATPASLTASAASMPTTPTGSATPPTQHLNSMASPNTSTFAAQDAGHSPAASMSPTLKIEAAAPRSLSQAPTIGPISLSAADGSRIHDGNIGDSYGASAGDEEHTQDEAEDQDSAEGVFSLDGDILYKAPPLFIPNHLEDGKLAAPTSPFAPLSVPRPTYRPPGTYLPKHTDYMKHPTVFDELQSSLFPPGTLESLHINMATPQEVVSDESLFAEPMSIEDRDSTTNMMSIDKKDDSRVTDLGGEWEEREGEETKEGEEGVDDNEAFVNKVAATLGMKKESVPKHRLQKEFRILVKSTPQYDPNIDPLIYRLPHDPRIDFIPCPKMRAQMIVHQHRYDVDELFELLINGAICHGSPLRRDSWQLPDEFFDRFGFLLGLEQERIRNKTWPPKNR
ncbi:hypothetical protein BGZ99_004587 [Dissophora globulifera]|uniref:BZIP domain-containing protein n=1 Tax=Dissophora globulifera TaxID=979702 RepID=A0A9P6RLP2_9FUNG|nr:hypothetical protein BGZ99_004587 [Dissophora globulifera]